MRFGVQSWTGSTARTSRPSSYPTARSTTRPNVCRNLGKGYAVKTGALASHGVWVALVDADLDLDPVSIPSYLEVARRERLDFAIGSKRHPDSVVHYPRSRRIASWWYQQLNRVLFRLDVRDTQVGLKVFSRRVVEEVMPLLLVKRFAFDLELLAVAKALGYGRVRELPVRLEYRFTGSGVRSTTVLLALWDTAAIFYRLRILRTYARKRRLLAGSLSPEELPLVEFVGDSRSAALLDYERLGEDGELVALPASGARPAGNWISAAVLFFAEPDVAAVVVPTFAPLRANLRSRVAAAVLESRLGVGSRRAGFFPGNVRTVTDHAAESIVMRKADHAAVLAAGIEREEWVAWLAAQGRRTIYTPDTSVSALPPPLVRPHLAGTFRHARARGRAARRTNLRSRVAAAVLESRLGVGSRRAAHARTKRQLGDRAVTRAGARRCRGLRAPDCRRPHDRAGARPRLCGRARRERSARRVALSFSERRRCRTARRHRQPGRVLGGFRSGP